MLLLGAWFLQQWFVAQSGSSSSVTSFRRVHFDGRLQPYFTNSTSVELLDKTSLDDGASTFDSTSQPVDSHGMRRMPSLHNIMRREAVDSRILSLQARLGNLERMQPSVVDASRVLPIVDSATPEKLLETLSSQQRQRTSVGQGSSLTPIPLVLLVLVVVIMCIVTAVLMRSSDAQVVSDVVAARATVARATSMVFAHDPYDAIASMWAHGRLQDDDGHSKLRDTYDVGEKLGEGAFGVVHEAVHRVTQERFAVKMIDLALSEKEWVLDEVEQMRRVQHEYLTVRIVEVCEDHCFFYLIMPKYAGDLLEGLMSHIESRGLMSEGLFVNIYEQLVASVAFVHSRGVAHRDLKPENYLMTVDELQHPTNRMTLTDFGLSEKLRAGCHFDDPVGSPCFWAPEVIEGKYGFGIDTFALGLTAYILLTGVYAFESPHQIRKWADSRDRAPIPEHVSVPTVEMLQRALERDPLERASAEGLHAAVKVHPLWGGNGAVADNESPSLLSHSGKGNSLWKLAQQRCQLNIVPDAVRQRRVQMINELDRQQAEKEHAEKHHKFDGRRHSVQIGQGSNLLDMSARLRMCQGLPFDVTGQWKDITHFEWWGKRQSDQAVIEGFKDDTFRKSRFGADAATESVSSISMFQADDLNNDDAVTSDDVRVLETILVRFGVDTSIFGVGGARPLKDLARERRDGHCAFLEDGKSLVRMVDLVVPVIRCQDGRILLEKRRVTNGENVLLNRFPGCHWPAWENWKSNALRAVAPLGLRSADLSFGDEALNIQIAKEESPRCPGMDTVYRRHMKAATIDSNRNLAQWGLPEGIDFEANGSTWGWVSEAECASYGLAMQPNGAKAAWYNALGPAKSRAWNPRTEEAIEERETVAKIFLDCGVDPTVFGEAALHELSKEMMMGESDLVKQDATRLMQDEVIGESDLDDGRTGDGRHIPLRIVSIILLCLHAPHGTVLVEAAETRRGGGRTEIRRLPGMKQHAHESPFVTVRRKLMTDFGLGPEDFEFDCEAGGVKSEESESEKYPGLRTRYKKSVVVARLVQKVSISAFPDDDGLNRHATR